jgi:hypothetical protein
MFTRRVSFSALALAMLLLSSVALAEGFKGSWSMRPADEPGKVYFGMTYSRKGGHSQTESDWDITSFIGLDRSSPKHDVKFAIDRDAGKFDCAGYFEAGEGAGTFLFTPNPEFAKEMAALGFTGIDEDRQFAMAVHDVTVEFARAMKAEKLTNLDKDKLIAFRIFNVSSQFIRELRAAGLGAEDADKLIAFRVHGVTAKMVAELRNAGIEADENELIAFRVHGVSPEFVQQVEALGYANPKPQQLISMRIFDITPKYIADLKARGLENLTIEKMVQLKVSGID